MLEKATTLKKNRKSYDYVSTPFKFGDKDKLITAINNYNDMVTDENKITSVSGLMRDALFKHMKELGIEITISSEI